MYAIVYGSNNHLVLNEEGNVLIKDMNTNDLLWIPQCHIKYNNENVAYVSNREIEVSNGETEVDNAVIVQDIVENEQNRQAWLYNDTLGLITAIESRYDELYHPQKKKKHFWTHISNDLVSQNINFSANNCYRKWQNLIRTYKVRKDNKKKSGRSPTHFQFFDRLDQLLGDKPNNSSPHTIDVGQLKNCVAQKDNNFDTCAAQVTPDAVTAAPRKTSGKNTYLKAKSEYYEKRSEIDKENSKKYQEYLAEGLEIKRQKLELDKRKVALMEQILKLQN